VLQQIAGIAVITIVSNLAAHAGSKAYFGNGIIALVGTVAFFWAGC
jgi:hypothetical protein